MCRLIAAHSWTRTGTRLLADLAKLTVKAAESDPYLKAITGGEDRHCHGHGYTIAYKPPTGSWTILHERHDSQDCQANLQAARKAAERLEELLSKAEKAYLVFHVRRAGRREPRGPLNAHPYPATVLLPDGQTQLYLAHNGGIAKNELARNLGVKPEAYTDSHLLALAAARWIREGSSPAEALAKGYRHAKSGYDIALLLARDQAGTAEISLLIATAMRKNLDEARKKYYEPVLFEAQGAAGYVSSTIRDLAPDKNMFATAQSGVYEITAKGARLTKTL